MSAENPRKVNAPDTNQTTREGVSLVCTIFNESKSIELFLQAVLEMNVLPAEVVVVDGGSTDGTINLVRVFAANHVNGSRIRLLVEPECNIQFTPGPVARGRNIGVSAATHEVVACTDAGCHPDVEWLGRITAPLFADPLVDVVGGWYLPDARSFFEEALALAILAPPESVSPHSFLPSSRSIAFRRSVWARVGGYPENTLWGEDTVFDLRLHAAGISLRYVPEAIVYWRMKDSFSAFVRLVYRYGFGDGFNRILLVNFLKNSAKIALLSGLAGLGIWVDKTFWWGVMIYLLIIPFARKPRALTRFRNMPLFPLVALLKVVSAFSYNAGYIFGRFSSAQPKVVKTD